MADQSFRLGKSGVEEPIKIGHDKGYCADNQGTYDVSEDKFQEHKHKSSYDIRRYQVDIRNNNSNGIRNDLNHSTFSSDDNIRSRQIRQLDSQGNEQVSAESQDLAAEVEQLDDEEFFQYLDSFDEDLLTLVSSSEAELDGKPKIVSLDHVDYVLDTIDAELDYLINKSLAKEDTATQRSISNSSGAESIPNNLQSGDIHSLGNIGNEHYIRKGRAAFLKIPTIEVSDADSVTSEDVQIRLQETFRKHNLKPKSSARRWSSDTSGGQQSDLDSIRTEEFERHFHGLMIKQIAGVPVRNFDDVTISSDLDSISSADVYHKFQEVLYTGGRGRGHKVRHASEPLETHGRHQFAGKHRRLQRAERVLDCDIDNHSEQYRISDKDSFMPEVSVRDVKSKTRNDLDVPHLPRRKGAKKAREKEREQRAAQAAAAAAGTGQNSLMKLLSPRKHGNSLSPKKSCSFPESRSPKNATPEKSPSCSPPRTPILLAPPSRFKDHSQLRQTHSFDETMRGQGHTPSQGYQWPDEHQVPCRHSPYIGSRQDSVSTYEEVESLSSHQVSSTNSRTNSEAPSRLQSFGSSGSSLDPTGEFVCCWRISGTNESANDLTHVVEKASVSRSRSNSELSSSGYSLSDQGGGTQSDRSSISDGSKSEHDLQSDIAKWVDQTRVETARKQPNANIGNGEFKSSEACAVQILHHNKVHKLTQLLNMDCNNITEGSKLPQETERELALRLRNTSSLGAFSRATSFDSSFGDFRNDIGWTPAEDVLMNLGFGGPDLGIPERFLTSWREKQYTKRMNSVRKLLRSHSSQSEPDFLAPRVHVMEKLQEEIDPTSVHIHTVAPVHAPTSISRKERGLQQMPNVPSPKKQSANPKCAPLKQMAASNSCDACTDTSDLPFSKNMKKVLLKTNVERLHQYRKQLKKAATVGSFSQTLAEIDRNRQGMPKMPPSPAKPNGSQIQQDLHKHINIVARKPRASGRGRRKYFVKQSSLPVSLGTLHEEEELVKPNPHYIRSQRSISLDTDDSYNRCPLKIVMEQPSIESREAMSRQGTCDTDIDEAIADVDLVSKQPDKMEKYLTVVKDITESKDSGFENEASQNSSPHTSPRSVEEEFCKGMDENSVNFKQQNAPSKSSFQSLPNNSQTFPNDPDKSTRSTEIASTSEGTNTDNLFVIRKKDDLDVQSTSSKISSRSNDSALDEKSHTSSRRSSVSSERSIGPRPSLVDMQEVFCQTIEDDDDSVFWSSPVPPDDEELVLYSSICVQTSLDLQSPPLSPLECGYNQSGRHDKQSSLKSQMTDSAINQSKEITHADFNQKDRDTIAERPPGLVASVSNAGRVASMDVSEPVFLDHMELIENSNVIQPRKIKQIVKKKLVRNLQLVEGNDKASFVGLLQAQDISMQTSLLPLSPLLQPADLDSVNQCIDDNSSNYIQKDSSDMIGSLDKQDGIVESFMQTICLPAKENCPEYSEIGSSPTQDELDNFVHDTSAGFMSDASDCLPESEDEQLAEKVNHLKRRRSLRPEWATPVKRDRLLALGDSVQRESSESSEASVSQRGTVNLYVPAKQESVAKADLDEETKDKMSDSDRRHSGNSTSDGLSLVTETRLSSIDESSPSSVYTYRHVLQDQNKSEYLFRSNSDLIKQFTKSKPQGLPSPHIPLKRSLSVGVPTTGFIRPRTLSEKEYQQSDEDYLGSRKHNNTMRGSTSTEYKSKSRLPINTPETLKLAALKLERLIHKGALRPMTYNESFKKDKEECESEVDNMPSKKWSTLEPTDKSTEKMRTEHSSLPDNKNIGTTPMPQYFLFPSPSSEISEVNKKHTIRQNTGGSDRSSERSVTSPSTRSPSIPLIITKAPTLDSVDSLDIVCFTELGEEKRPPLKAHDYGSWSSQSSSPGFLVVPSFHSPDSPDFENRPRTTSPTDPSSDIKFKPNSPELLNKMDRLDIFSPHPYFYSPLSPQKLEHLYTDSTSPSSSPSSAPKEEITSKDASKTILKVCAEAQDKSVRKYFSSTHHEMCHTVPLPKVSVNDDGRKVPTILYELATIPCGSSKNQLFTIHLEVLPLNYQEMNNNVIQSTQKCTSLKFMEIDLKEKNMININVKENAEDLIGGWHYRAPFYWDVTDTIPVFPLYRNGHFTTNISRQDNLIPRNRCLHDANVAMPTFDEICSKAGQLIQNLQQTVTIERFVPIEPAPVDISEIMQDQCGNGNSGSLVIVNVVDQNEDSACHDRDVAVVEDKKDAIEERAIKRSQRLFEGSQLGGSITGISIEQKKKINGNHQATPPDWGAKLETLANLEELVEAETDMRRRLNSLEKSYDYVKDDKQVALKELRTLHEAVHRNKADIQNAEEMTTRNLEKADAIRSELMVLEYQRDQAHRELEDLEESIHAKRLSAGTGKDREVKRNNLSTTEIHEIIQERDDLKSQLRRGQRECSFVEQSDLERQLSATKKDLFCEQKSTKAMVDQMNEINNNMSTLEEDNKQLQRVLQDKDEYIAAAKASIREKEQALTQCRQELIEVKRALEDTKDTKDALIQERRDDFKKLDSEKARIVEGLKDALKREKLMEVDQLRFTLEKEKKEALARQEEKLQGQMAVKHSLLLTKEEELILLRKDMEHWQRLVEMADNERTLEMQKKEAVEKAKADLEEEMSRNGQRELALREEEFATETTRLHQEIREGKMHTDNLSASLSELKEEIAGLQQERLAASQEKVKAISESRDAVRQEVQVELDNLREQMTQDKIKEVEHFKQKLVQQDEELIKLRSEVKKKGQKLAPDASDRLSSHGIVAEINEQCKQMAGVIGMHTKLNGLKKNKSSKSLLASPGQSPTSSSSNHLSGNFGMAPGRTQVMAALTNLRSSNEELRVYVQTLKEDSEKQKKMIAKLQREKDIEGKHLKDSLHAEKSQDLSIMRDKLVQEHLKVVEGLQQMVHKLQTGERDFQQRLLDKDEELREIQHGMAKWKEDSAYKMAKKFEEELSKELEIRLQEQAERQALRRSGLKSLDRVSDPALPSTLPTTDGDSIRLLHNLQERVRDLQAENISLRQNGRTFANNRSPQQTQNEVGEKEQQIYHFQQKVMLLDRQLHIAEDRCRDNAMQASEKAAENSKLQSALAQQTKELLRMERAYAKLSQAVRRSPVAL